jgi:hypothetical protein
MVVSNSIKKLRTYTQLISITKVSTIYSWEQIVLVFQVKGWSRSGLSSSGVSFLADNVYRIGPACTKRERNMHPKSDCIQDPQIVMLISKPHGDLSRPPQPHYLDLISLVLNKTP